MASKNIYDDFIMDHIKNARGFRAIEDATRKASGSNPLCGDDLVVYIILRYDRIEDVAFQCTCCGISMASASMMTESVKGQRADDVKSWLDDFTNALIARGDPALYGNDSVQHVLLNTVHSVPARTRCAALPWLTLSAALENRAETVSMR